jgi:alkanesulfonate monooxygenase SsuD/methylene tetrahydromethanopterin reductase-like flavin-dependent oxidoreductase (luciferase family)
VRLAIWSTTTPRENSSHPEMFRRQLDEVELAERIGIDQIWFFEHHLQPTAPVPSPNLLIAAASRTTRRIRFSSMVNILPFRHPLLVAEEAAMLDNLTDGRLDMGLGRGLATSGTRHHAATRSSTQPVANSCSPRAARRSATRSSL